MIFNNLKHRKKLTSFLLFLPIISSTVLFAQSNELTFEEEFNIGSDTNFARTKDADIGDINADGWPDILDANSNNIQNGTGLTIRFNNRGNGFNSETIIEGSDNVTTYDADLVDLNRDGYPDLIRTESVRSGGRSARIAVYKNLQGSGDPGRAWFDLRTADDSASENECPDDIAFGDLNNDGWTDFAIARRRFNCVTGANQSSGVSVYINTSENNPNGDISFELTADLPATNTDASIHDVVIVNATFGSLPEILALNERGRNELYLNRGGDRPSFLFSNQNLGSNSTTAAVGNLNLIPALNLINGNRNARGLDNLVLVDRVARTVNFYDQRSSAFGQQFNQTPFQVVDVPEFSLIYDVELGDFNLDGYLDVLVNGFSNNSVPASLVLIRKPSLPLGNNEAGDFVKLPITLFPNQPNDDYLSGDALDYDLDGDLDIYVAGGDGGSPNGCFGCVQNRFYENTIQSNAVYNNFENGLDGWTQSNNDTNNWTLRSGQTSSFGTGPARAKSGNSYLYLETSSGGAFDEGDTAFLDSPVIFTNSINRHTLSFDYHMHGDQIGSLHFDIIRDGEVTAEDILIIRGEQQSDTNDGWRSASLNLDGFVQSAFGGFRAPIFQVRVRAVAAGGFRGDIAIDNLMITNNNGL